MKIREVATPKAKPRFDAAPTIDGYEVIDMRDGRSVSGSMTQNNALDACRDLNYAVLDGPRAIAQALGAIEDEIPVEAGSFYV